MTSISRRVKRSLIVLIALSVALVIAALIVVALRPPPPVLAEDTPEGVVQRYITAVQAKDLPTAQRYTKDGATLQFCDEYASEGTSSRTDLLDTVITDQTARVNVSFGEPGGDLYSVFGGYSYQDWFELTRAEGNWKITYAPWHLDLCTAEERGY